MSFDYHLPADLIAQHPPAERDAARLMLVRRGRPGDIEHHTFRDLPGLLGAGDLVVLNDTRVLPARLVGRREPTGGAWEGLFLRATESGLWEMLFHTRGRLRQGDTVSIEPGPLRLAFADRDEHGRPLFAPLPCPAEATLSAAELLARHGRVPLPPYIRKGREEPGDRERYQTVYADRPGSVAAPTAGLHFTPALLGALGERGVGVTRVTLHVGPGTFAPIKGGVEDHVMHREWCEVSAEAAGAVRDCRTRGGRVVAAGTTAARALESAARGGEAAAFTGETDIFIREPFAFRAVGGLVTNFHLPKTTLLCLVSALAGTETAREAYGAAVRERYRFYSYGDAMLIV